MQVLRGYKRAAVPMVIYGVALWGVALGGGYALGIGGIGVGAPMAATGFWLAAVVGMTLTAALVSVYFLRVSRAPRPGGPFCTLLARRGLGRTALARQRRGRARSLPTAPSRSRDSIVSSGAAR